MRRLDYYWYRQSPWLLLLWPLSLVFCLLVVLRRWLYRAGLNASCDSAVPVIVVGNITVGGSGKTPLVLWLAHFLKQKGFRPGIVSRGYGGQAESWPQPVSVDSDPVLVGDEAVLLAKRSGCPMVVGPDRCGDITRLLENGEVDVIISDDGMQHYRMQRNIEIAVIDGERRLGNRFCLPAGPLREPVSRLRQVDYVVSNGAAASSAEWSMNLQGEMACAMLGDERRELASFGDRPVHVVAGIGNPERFFAYVRQRGIEVIPHAYDDHHPYQAGELHFGDDYPVLMTEKDAVKYFPHADARHWFVPVDASLPDEFGDSLLASLEKVHG